MSPSNSGFSRVRNGSQVNIEMADGSIISVDNADDPNADVVLAIDLGEGRDGVMVRLSPPVAAYLAGQLAMRAGAILG